MFLGFAVGMATRVAFVSLTMLPVTAPGVWLNRRHGISHAPVIA